MPGVNSLTSLSNLLLDLQQNPKSPYKMNALKGAEQIFMPPQPEPELTPDGSDEDLADEARLSSQAPPGMDALQISPPPIPSFSSGQSSGGAGGASGAQNTGQETGGYQNRHVLDSPESESKPGFFKSDEFTNIANIGLGMLGGAAGGALAGNWRAGMAGGGAVQLADFQAKQKDMLDRRHKAWESAYNEASALPVDIHTTPGMEEVAKAQQALMKDLQDGKVDNEQNLTNFLKVKAMYGGDIEKMSMDKKLADQKRMEDEKFTNNLARAEQEAQKWYAIANDKNSDPIARQNAEAKLAEYEAVLRQQQHQAEQDKINNRRADTAEVAQASRDKNQHSYNTTMISGQQSRERIANSQIASREKINKQAQFGSKLKALVSQASKNNPEIPEKVHLAEAVKSLGGIIQISPGNVMIMGEPVRLQEIFGDRPKLWGNDPPGTPSPAGWDVLVALVANQVELAGAQARQPQPMGISDYPPQAFQR